MNQIYNIVQNSEMFLQYDRIVCKNSILQDIETVKRNKTNVLRLIDDIKINWSITLEIIPFDNDKRIFLVNDTAKNESEKYTFLFSAQKYSDLFLLLQGSIIGLGI